MLTGLLLLAATSPAITWSADFPAPAPRGQVVRRDGTILMPGRADGPGGRLVCFASSDEGKTWMPSGLIASDPSPKVDLGDGNIVQSPSGELLAVYRHNHHEKPDYAIEVSVSKDGGKTWQPHSTVATSAPPNGNPSRGLWSPILFVNDRGELQCYFDDEDTPFQRGFPGHQWLTMKTYSTRRKQWENPVTVARAHNPKLLSRDGMASVVQIGKGRLLCAFESVQTKPPHAGVVRMVTSGDNGRTWSWSREEREVLYQPRDVRFHAFCPSLAMLPGGSLLAFFATNEDRAEPGISGTPARDLALDTKYVASPDGGRSWEKEASLLYAGTHRNYLAGVTVLPGKEPRLFASFLDFDRGALARIGTISKFRSTDLATARGSRFRR